MAVGAKWGNPKMGCPGKWNHGLKPAFPWWCNFGSYPCLGQPNQAVKSTYGLHESRNSHLGDQLVVVKSIGSMAVLFSKLLSNKSTTKCHEKEEADMRKQRHTGKLVRRQVRQAVARPERASTSDNWGDKP